MHIFNPNVGALINGVTVTSLTGECFAYNAQASGNDVDTSGYDERFLPCELVCRPSGEEWTL